MKEIGTVRPSQYITTFGPGAIVDLPDFSIIMGGINKWERTNILRYSKEIEEPRLKKKLKINKIRSIPISPESKSIGTIPAYQFPEFHVCPNCRKLGTSKNFVQDEEILYCQNYQKDNMKPCPRVKTHPVRFLTACKNGHIDDFPWAWYVHSKANLKYENKKCQLYLEDTGKSGSIKDLIVRCQSCDIERSLNEAFSNEKMLGRCNGRRPWLGKRIPNESSCEESKKLLLRGASNLYFPVIESSIAIPFDPDQGNPIEQLVRDEIEIENESLTSNLENFKFFVSLHKELKQYDVMELWEITQRLKNGQTEEDLLLPEWDAIISGQNDFEEPDFEIEKQEIPERFNHLLSNLIKVKRLKEVMVLKGFTRINPVPDATARLTDDGSENGSSETKMAPISDSKLDWLPGVESFGEGIFISINHNALTSWEKVNSLYASSLKGAHRKQFLDKRVPEGEIPPFPGIRYVLLHTLSHSLIRELCLHSGYSASALKERIYSDSQSGMAGILIYTASVDSEGSLGGLVELGESSKFEAILARSLAAAKYCSGDPLCAEHDPVKLNDVNGAACHSCLLISETSCEKANKYLDRSLLVSTVADLEREFFINEKVR